MNAHEHAHREPSEFWEEFYGGDHPWSGRVNGPLEGELAARPLEPGSALDLGCGTGGDAVWLAERDWQVTGTDLAEGALARAREAAAAAGVTVRFVRAVLPEEFPAGEWDLITASYLHSPTSLARDAVLARAAEALAPGGTLLVVSHERGPSWRAPEEGHLHDLPTLEDVVASLALPGVELVHAERLTLPTTSPEGVEGTKVDTVVRVRRA